MRTLKDEAIAQLVVARLSQDLRTCGQTIDVLVQDEELLLVGSCDTQSQKAAAKMIALSTYGVQKVKDNLSVRQLRQAI